MQPYYSHTPREDHARPATPGSPSYEKESHIGNDMAARQVREASDMHLREYEEHQARLGKGIESSMFLLGDIRNFNKHEWQLRYPLFSGSPARDADTQPQRPAMMRRTLTFADEPAFQTDVVLESTITPRHALKRSLTIAPGSSATAQNVSAGPSQPRSQTLNSDFSVFDVELNLGAARSAKNLVSELERKSMSHVLDTVFSNGITHLSQLRKRVDDPHSRVLVTGDLNAGKSTLINALLRRHEVMPTDQQPFTTRFVEIVSAKENEGREEIHVFEQSSKYDPADKSTYTIENIDRLEALATDADSDASAPPMRVFLKEAPSDIANPSILHNGSVDISLIDAPGLNRDSIKTTANFARQPEIDVIVFVVSAANHFTLSGKEFIWQAGREKAHLFIVVNRFDQIRDKERCRRAVLEQIKQLSPETYADAADLVHFVDSAKVALGCSDDDSGADDLDQAFSHLEHSLRSFVLVNRVKSKLGPAQHYVSHLLGDMELLVSANSIVAAKELDEARQKLQKVKPVLDRMKKGKEGLEEALVHEEEASASQSTSRTKTAMLRALDRVGRGELAAPAPALELPSYPGLLGVWDYTREVKRVLLASLDFAAFLGEEDARRITAEGVERVDQLGDQYLPEDVERTKRVFNKGAMFSARPPSKSKRRASSAVNALGLGLANRQSMVEVNVSDIIDIQHHIFIARSQIPAAASTTSNSTALIPSLGSEVGSLGVASLAFGALTIGGKAYGIRTLMDSVLRISDLASHPLTRKYFGPAVGVLAVGAVAYMVYELPRSIPRNVGRHIQSTLLVSSGIGEDLEAVSMPFADAQAARISSEVRKVMRLAAWDMRERHRAGVDAKNIVVKECEEIAKKAMKAIEYFESVESRVVDVREQVGIKL